MNGVDYMGIDTATMLSVFYSAIIDDVVNMGVSRHEVREEIEKKLEEIKFQYEQQKFREATVRGDSAAPDMRPEAAPFELTPQMQQMFGLHPPKAIGKGGEV